MQLGEKWITMVPSWTYVQFFCLPNSLVRILKNFKHYCVGKQWYYKKKVVNFDEAL